MRHVSFFSGGLSSFFASLRVVESAEGDDEIILLFTDTLIEDEDLYRFLDDGVEYLKKLRPSLDVKYIYLADGRRPWEAMKDARFIGNSLLAPCSKFLKQKVARDWVFEYCDYRKTTLYLGLDWTEEHRFIAPRKHWAPFSVEYPMYEKPWLDKNQMQEMLTEIGIEVPRLYKMGFSHNNCGGFCVRGGQAHFKRLKTHLPALFNYHAAKEQELREFLDTDSTILRRSVKGKKQYLPLMQLGQEIDAECDDIDEFDIGGCACFVE